MPSTTYEAYERVAFDHPTEKIFCARCGKQCVPLGHMFTRFLLCPTHGEFTIAPVVMQDTTGWYARFSSEQERAMWATCRGIDARYPDGAPDGAARVKGYVPDGE